ncbi:MAG: cobalt/nickel transport system permease protein [Mycobacterium sp.]|jgi:cobalt/nickel transport system permease protein|nr:cobalt/nickel transport system permease protein [Mycobacterium sp.]
MTAAVAPDWLLQRDAALCPCGCIGKRRRGSYVEKTLTGAAGVLRQVIFSDDASLKPGLLQRIEPRVKMITVVGLLVAGSFLHTIAALIVLYVATLALAASSGLPLGFFIKRVWLFVPIFTGIVLIPATLSIVTPGDLIVPLWHWHGHAEGITRQGMLSALLVVSRVASSISLVALVTLTTPWTRLLASLRALAVPRMFILVIGMAYRYLFLLLATVIDMYQARKARTVGVERHDKAARRFVFASAGAVLAKSLALSEEVHQAMVSRGYRGDAKVIAQPKPTWRDCGFAAAGAAFAACLLIGEHLLVR